MKAQTARKSFSWLPGAAVAAGAAVFAVLHPGPSEGRKMDLARPAAEDMTRAADAFLTSLSSPQQTKATFPFEDDERLNWHFIPKARKGIPMKELDAGQRAKAEVLLKTGLSAKGWMTAQTIMSLEHVLKHVENNPGRDVGLYYVTVFGKPDAKQPWGWRVEGHHMSLNFTVADGHVAATSPFFLGANPAEVRVDAPNGPAKGTRPLAIQEDMGRRLFNSLTAEQKKTALLPDQAYADILTGAKKQVDPLKPDGVGVDSFTVEQKRMLSDLLDAYALVMAPKIAEDRLARARAAGLEKLHFAWAGAAEPGQGHYYRVQGPTFLIEYDNTQNGANHVHSVWRDFNGDFGRDVLAEHRAASHQAK